MTNEEKELTNEPTPPHPGQAVDAPHDDNPDCPLCREHAHLESNAETLAAMRELEEGRGTRLFGTVEELLAELNTEGADEERR